VCSSVNVDFTYFGSVVKSEEVESAEFIQNLGDVTKDTSNISVFRATCEV